MKKYILTIIIITFFLHYSQGQKWHFDRINKDTKYKYEYWFSFQNEDDTNSFELIKTPSKVISRKIHGIIFNRNNEKIDFANIQILDTNHNIILNTIPNFDGEFIINTKLENFEIKVTYVGYDKFSLMINLKPNEDLNLKIKLGLGPELTVYQINSKRKLKPEEINQIIDCVKNNRDKEEGKDLSKCINLKLYQLWVQI